jgi:allophanate hydrolase subunit 2
MRFKGPRLTFGDRPDYLIRDAGPDPSNIVDDVIPVGGIQCPSGVEVIIMGVENPTVGGFAKIATVIAGDLWVAGQVRPGQTVRFRAVDVGEAIQTSRALIGLATDVHISTGG